MIERLGSHARFMLAAAVLSLGACGGGGGGGAAAPLSQDTMPEGARIDVSAANYFPVAAGDSWAYDDINGGLLVGTMNRTASSSPGGVSVQEAFPGMTPEDATRYRVTADGLQIDDPLDAETDAPGMFKALPNLIEHPTPFYPAGKERKIVRSGSMEADFDGDGKNESFNMVFTDVFVGFESMTVLDQVMTVAHFRSVIKVDIIGTASGTTSSSASDESFYASNIGLVRAERSSTLLTPGGVPTYIDSPYVVQLHGAHVGGKTWAKNALPEPNSLVPPFSRSLGLSHDVIDAAYVPSLDSIIMTSARPDAAVYIYGVGTGTERKQLLSLAPSSLSVGPAGTDVAIASGRSVFYLPISEIGQSSAALAPFATADAPITYLLLNGHGSVMVESNVNQTPIVQPLNLATKATYGGFTYSRGDMVLSADGNSFYSGAGNTTSKEHFVDWGLQGETIVTNYSASSLTERFWANRERTRLFSNSGSIMIASEDPATDRTPVQQLTFDPLDYNDRLDHVEQVSSSDAIYALSSDGNKCAGERDLDRCFSHLTVFSPDGASVQSRYSVPPVNLDGTYFPQRARFIFATNSGEKVLITTLFGAFAPTRENFLSYLP